MNEYDESTRRPSYYVSNSGVECWDVIKDLLGNAGLKGFYIGNVVKYMFRAGLKDGESAVSDYEKAAVYVQRLITLEKEMSEDEGD